MKYKGPEDVVPPLEWLEKMEQEHAKRQAWCRRLLTVLGAITALVAALASLLKYCA